jgi:hypothetical protein
MNSEGNINAMDIGQEVGVAEDINHRLIVKKNPGVGDQSIILDESKISEQLRVICTVCWGLCRKVHAGRARLGRFSFAGLLGGNRTIIVSRPRTGGGCGRSVIVQGCTDWLGVRE